MPILAVGGQIKGTFALGQGHQAMMSHHLGDLDRLEAYRAFVRDVDLYQQLFGMRPRILVHDLHPDYASTRYAQEQLGVALLAVQHHHAHLASCMAEHGLREPVIGVTFDGTGYGTDGAIWGGEFLIGDYRSVRRAAHFRAVGMPGGDQAIREPWRMAVAHLLDAGLTEKIVGLRVPTPALNTIRRMIECRLQTPLTTSAGRLFDAVAALVGLRDRVSYEGQAAMELEWLALETPPDGTYAFDLETIPDPKSAHPRLVVDTRPLMREMVQDLQRNTTPNRVARRFHCTLVEIIADVCRRLRQDTGLQNVVLSGGVFLNALLTQEVSHRLCGKGFSVYRHRLVPPNDGGLCLGQLAIAAATCGQDVDADMG